MSTFALTTYVMTAFTLEVGRYRKYIADIDNIGIVSAL